MGVRIDLTQEGLDHVEDTVQLLFVYIGMLKRIGPRRAPPRRQSSSEEKTCMRQTVLPLVKEVHNRLLNCSTTERDSSASVKTVLEQLIPRNMICFVVMKENSDLENLEREQYYGIEYRRTKLDAASLKRFGRALRRKSELFYLPEEDGKYSPRKLVLKTTKNGEMHGWTLRSVVLKVDSFQREASHSNE
ncbi:hypothetical protein QR680_004426 [Steinernema hermaphroditum]|uniref:Peptidase M16 middle/third domain-containing protein n=1 Tax=Steinernema hermaphroditum TaxID=289476 RepID=A0AA39HQ28_9BILA|nr:hypothetical protein QR680_004426 [Steinernema hermaphroditum]